MPVIKEGGTEVGAIKMKRRLTLLLLIVLVSVPLQAEKYALLVGINDYPDEISSLKYCVADVEAFSQALVEVAGFAEKNVYLMTSRMSGRKEPTHVNVIKQLDILSQRVKPEDTFIFYFSGHGISKAGQSFLLTTNSDTTTPNTLTISAVDLNQVSQILSSVQARQLLTVIDACRNDPDSGRGEEDNLLSK
ncbi:MAG: caspase family protein, partial [Candidatus Poribacteria bacterium]|nr:caspase family protein [Candidatus Poribacteria bacterium]